MTDLQQAYIETYEQNLALAEEAFAAEQEAYERYVEEGPMSDFGKPQSGQRSVGQ